MKRRFSRWLDTMVEKNWNRHIDKQIRRVENAEWDLWTQKCVLKELVDKFNEIYGTNLDLSPLTDGVEDIDWEE